MHGKGASLERIRRKTRIAGVCVSVYVSRDLLITCQQAHVVVVDAAMIWAYVTNVLEIALIRHCHGASLYRTQLLCCYGYHNLLLFTSN